MATEGNDARRASESAILEEEIVADVLQGAFEEVLDVIDACMPSSTTRAKMAGGHRREMARQIFLCLASAYDHVRLGSKGLAKGYDRNNSKRALTWGESLQGFPGIQR